MLLREVERQEELIRELEQKVQTDPAVITQLVEERGKWAESTERLRKFDKEEYTARAHDEQVG